MYASVDIHKVSIYYLIMPAYNKINDFCARAIRKLSDYSIFVNGRKTECTRLTKIPDVWGNADSETISASQIQAIFIFPPGEMPLIRLRAGHGTQAQVQSSGIYFYDILPVEIYIRWEDKIEVGDVLFFTAKDENGDLMPVVFRLLDSKGAFSSQLVWRKFIAAPITNLDTEIPEDLKERLLAMIS
jgi:hypothetical protein